MIETIGLGAVMVMLFVALVGVRRLPWRYTAAVGLGFGLVFVTVRLVTVDLEPEVGVWLGAVGGSLSTLAFERGERARERRIAAVLGSPSSPVT